jgi:D-serine deaminase-like pyridoxal phosphate-dependent protein
MERKSMEPDARLGPNARLIGVPRSRLKLDTPALVLDLDALNRNIQRMAAAADEFGVKLRPHAKCHKSAEIAKLQLEYGASGICCATIGEAEVMASAGVTDILITSPLAIDEKIARAVELRRSGVAVMVVADNPANVQQLSAHFARVGEQISVLVDVDPGMERTGVVNHRMAIELARLVSDLDGVNYDGIQCYAGHIQHIASTEERQDAALSVLGSLRVLCEELKTAGLAPRIVSGGGTGSYDIDGTAGVLTELQVGSYVFMDAQYNRVWAANGLKPPFEVSLFVQASVISNNRRGSAICDAGIKHFAVDGGVPIVRRGASPDSVFAYYGDEHGRLTLPEGAQPLALGDRVEFVVPHCDPTVNLFDFFHCVREDALVDIWRVDARGA